MNFTYEDIKEQARAAAAELVETAKLKKGDIFVIEGKQHIATCDAIFLGDAYDGEFVVEDETDCYFEHEFA